MKDNWNDITINEYNAIVKIIDDKALDEIEKQIKILSIITEKVEEEFWNMNVGQLADYTNKLSFLNSFDFDKTVKVKTIKIGEYELQLDHKMHKFTVAQYVDFQNYWSQKNKDMSKVLSCFLIPRGKKYNEGYDIEDLINTIGNNISITMANSIGFFLLKKLDKSTRFSQIFLRLLAKRAMKDLTPVKKKKKKKPLMKRLKSLIGFK